MASSIKMKQYKLNAVLQNNWLMGIIYVCVFVLKAVRDAFIVHASLLNGIIKVNLYV